MALSSCFEFMCFHRKKRRENDEKSFCHFNFICFNNDVDKFTEIKKNKRRKITQTRPKITDTKAEGENRKEEKIRKKKCAKMNEDKCIREMLWFDFQMALHFQRLM